MPNGSFFTCDYLLCACSCCNCYSSCLENDWVLCLFFGIVIVSGEAGSWSRSRDASLLLLILGTSVFIGVFKKKNSNSEHRLCQPSQIPSQNFVALQALQCWSLDLYLRVNLLVSMWVWDKALGYTFVFKPAVDLFNFEGRKKVSRSVETLVAFVHR